MIDKQIRIDGVDITNCIHRATNKLCGDINPYCRCYTGSCKNISNCYYKQLKRKEQECEGLKENYKNAMTSLDAFMRNCANLRCKKRNIEKKYKKEICKQQKSIVKLKTENEHLTEKEEEARHYLEEAEKFKNCLTEIKEVCNKTVCDYLQCSLNYNHSKDFECEKTSCNRAKRRKFILQILQKISECEVE